VAGRGWAGPGKAGMAERKSHWCLAHQGRLKWPRNARGGAAPRKGLEQKDGTMAWSIDNMRQNHPELIVRDLAPEISPERVRRVLKCRGVISGFGFDGC